MKNTKSLIIMSIFSFLLVACGMKGPLYHAPVAKADESIEENEQATAAESQSVKKIAQQDEINNDSEAELESHSDDTMESE